MESKTFTVYMHIVPNGKIYIGMTCQIPERRWSHGKSYHCNKQFYNDILAYGWDNIEHKMLYADLSQQEAQAKEIELIKLYETNNPLKGYNSTKGGEPNGMYGAHHNESTCAKLRELAKERFADKTKHPMYGTHRSEITKHKLSVFHKGLSAGEKNYFYGKHYSGESHPCYGKHISEEHKKRLSEFRKGRYMNEKAYNSKPVRNVETGETFPCALEVYRKYGYDFSSIHKCCKGKYKTCHGYHWEYVEQPGL